MKYLSKKTTGRLRAAALPLLAGCTLLGADAGEARADAVTSTESPAATGTRAAEARSELSREESAGFVVVALTLLGAGTALAGWQAKLGTPPAETDGSSNSR
jgi:hypothetical protein